MRISIFGLGYVGAVAAACLADSGHDVIVVDTDPAKVRGLEQGRAPIVEPGLAVMIARNVGAGRLRATLSCADAVMHSDMSMICVGTPPGAGGTPNLDDIEIVCRDIGAALKNKTSFHGVVLRSTVPPSTSKTVVLPALEQASGKKAGEGFGFAVNPEFLREAQAIADYFDPPKIVIGATDDKTARAVSSLYAGLPAPEIITDIDVAEGIKYADNIWHAVKVTFANEMGSIFKILGVDSHKVMEVFCLDTKLNISPAYLRPGFAYGGSCLPKDLQALRACAWAKGVGTPFLDGVTAANEAQIRRGFDMVMKSGKKKVVLMGLAFKAGSDDLRESPLVRLADMLIQSGVELKIYDPGLCRAANAGGFHQKVLRGSFPHISGCLVERPEDLTAGSEVFIIGNHGENFADILRKQANDNAQIIDLVRLKDGTHEGREKYEGICW